MFCLNFYLPLPQNRSLQNEELDKGTSLLQSEHAENLEKLREELAEKQKLEEENLR